MAPSHRRSWAGRLSGTTLPDIPEAMSSSTELPMAARATPGPNAFAQQEARVQKHRLQSNAFYQQEFARRTLTPATAIHPALREEFSLEDNMTTSSSAGVSDSGVTTMSPFIQSVSGQTPPTPPMLVPEDCTHAYPTDRGVIEDRREKLQHEHAGTQTERTPVFVYSPKIDSSEFSKSTSHATPKKKKVGVLDWVITNEQTKTPKKGLLERLKFTTPRTSNVTAPTAPLATSRGYSVGGETLPPKAKAVLTSSPHKANLGRSPSKRKGIFSRKGSEQTPLDASAFLAAEPRSAGALTVNFSDSTGKTPQTVQTAFSDPTHNRPGQAKRAISQTQSDLGDENKKKTGQENNVCGVSRSQSLQYFDRTIPPTPPAKNTPPQEKEPKLQQESRRIMDDHRRVSDQRQREMLRNITPKKEMIQKPSSRLSSPIRQRIFDDDTPTRETVKLIGADEHISPTKTGTYANKELPKLVKQPSLYSMHGSVFPDLQDESSFEEMKKRTDGLGLEGLSTFPEKFYDRETKITYSPSIYSDEFGARPGSVVHNTQLMWQQSPPLPPILEQQRQATKESLSAKQSVDSDGTIPFMYPDLASDPSRTDLKKAFYTHRKSSSESQLPVHLSTPSRQRSRSPSRESSGSNLIELDEDTPLSPTNYSCASAMPSPLQFLPATVYKPTQKKGSDVEPGSPSSTRTLTKSCKRGRIEIFKPNGSSVSFGPGSPFENLPTLSPSIRPTFYDSPPDSVTDSESEPEKQGRSISPISNITQDISDQGQERSISPILSILESADDQSEQEQLDPQQLQEHLKIMIRRMKKQTDEIISLRDELRDERARNYHLPALRVPSNDSSAGDSNVPHASSVANVSEDTRASESIASYVAQGGLTQMGLHHRLNQRRVDQGYDAQDEADIARHERSDQGRKNTSAQAWVEEVIDVVGMLAKRVEQLEATKDGK